MTAATFLGDGEWLIQSIGDSCAFLISSIDYRINRAFPISSHKLFSRSPDVLICGYDGERELESTIFLPKTDEFIFLATDELAKHILKNRDKPDIIKGVVETIRDWHMLQGKKRKDAWKVFANLLKRDDVTGYIIAPNSRYLAANKEQKAYFEEYKAGKK
jgi:hypothetical protein